jgi:hypothetical protein
MSRNLLLLACVLFFVFIGGMTVKTATTANGAFPVPTATPSSVWTKRFGSTANDVGQAVAFDSSGNLYATGYFTGTVDFGGGPLTSNGSTNPDVFLIKYSSTGVFVWSKRIGGIYTDAGTGVAVDSGNNVIVVGTVNGLSTGTTVDFGGGAVSIFRDLNIFVAKYNSAGTYQWAKTYGSSSGGTNNNPYAVAVDSSSNIAVTGSFQNTIDFGTGPIAASGFSTDAFAFKLSAAAGATVWARGMSSSTNENGRGVAFDPNGNTIVDGFFTGAVDFGCGALTSAGGDDIFVAKYNSAGVCQWSKRFGDPSHQDAFAVTVDLSSNIILTGQFAGTFNFGGGSNLVNTNFLSTDIFLAKLDSSGNYVWSQQFGAINTDRGSAVTVDSSGNVTFTGFFLGTVNFGGGAVTSSGGLNTFLASYNSAGTHIWSKTFTGSNFGTGVAVDSNANVGLTGQFEGTTNFGAGPLVSAGLTDVFLLEEILVVPTPTPTPTPTPASVSISGHLSYCASASPIPMPNVTVSLTGSATQSTVTDSSGNYTFPSVPAGGNYTVTVSKSGTISGVNTVDASRILGFIGGTFPLTSCQQLAADVNQDHLINNTDVTDILNFIAGNVIAGNFTGQWRFNLASRTYTNLTTNQTSQNYDAMLLGEVSGNWVLASAGPDQSIITTSTALAGSAFDVANHTLTYSWSNTAGPSSPTIGNATTLSPTVSGMTTGTYTFHLAVSDGVGNTATDDVDVATTAANTLPTCKPNQVIGTPATCKCTRRIIGNPPRCK